MTAPLTHIRFTHIGARFDFVRHLVEMMVAMWIGMPLGRGIRGYLWLGVQRGRPPARRGLDAPDGNCHDGPDGRSDALPRSLATKRR